MDKNIVNAPLPKKSNLRLQIYRSITVLAYTSKMMIRVMLNRYADKLLIENKCNTAWLFHNTNSYSCLIACVKY